MFEDPDVEEEIAAKWLWAKTQGKDTSISGIADQVAKRYSKSVSKAEKIGAEKALEGVMSKEQASLGASSQSASQSKTSSVSQQKEELMEKVRKGSNDSLAELMKAVPFR